jgi:hypothetical protein
VARSAQSAICAARSRPREAGGDLALLTSQYGVLLQRADDCHGRVVQECAPPPHAPLASAEDVVYAHAARAARLGAARESLGDAQAAQRQYAEASRCLAALVALEAEPVRKPRGPRTAPLATFEKPTLKHAQDKGRTGPSLERLTSLVSTALDRCKQ